MSAAEIVRFVTTEDTNEADSDEGEKDDFQRPGIIRQQVAEHAKIVQDLMLC
jgi:hypothetical protein